MNPGYPISERIFVLKSEESLGPFTIDELLEALEEGRFNLQDVCLREGSIETERIRDVIDWEDDPSADEKIESEPEAEESFDDEDEIWEEPSQKAAPAPTYVPPPGAVLYSGHPSILTYPMSVIGVVGGVVGAIWLFPIDLRFSITCLLICGISLTYLTFIRFTRDYLITTKRIELVSGLIARSSNEVRITDIRAINVICKGVSGIFGIGTVDFFTTGDDPEVRFERVWAAEDIKQLVRRVQDSKD